MEHFNVGDVFYYNSQFLNKSHQPHYHIVVLNDILGRDGLQKLGLVIITSYSYDKELYFKGRYGNSSYVILDNDHYAELSHKSIVNCFVYEEDMSMLHSATQKESIDSNVLDKIKFSALNNKRNFQRIKKLLR